MERIAKLSLLIDFYGGLLTDKQYNIIDLYYNSDYSLSEISEILGISRQGVHDGLKRAEKTLFSYEEKLELVDKFIEQNNNVKTVIDKLKNVSVKNIEDSIEILETMVSKNEL